MAWAHRVLASQTWGLEFGLQNPHKKPRMIKLGANHSNKGVGGGGEELDLLASRQSLRGQPRSQRNTLPQKLGDSSWETPKWDPWPPYVHTHVHTHTHLCMYVHKKEHIYQASRVARISGMHHGQPASVSHVLLCITPHPWVVLFSRAQTDLRLIPVSALECWVSSLNYCY